ncbi:hypothetical protein BDZ89DRAFT_1085579 [Hymenopellis radicata]|nr:hypothetical protein BDZ89DRAFT_1085579 [Hymenopellis radicata]
MTRAPSANLGVAVLTNDDTYGPYFIQVIKYRIMDKLLGLNVTDWNSIYKQTVADAYVASLAVTPAPANASAPSVAYADLAGTYSNGGYGNIDLCYVSDSSSCQDILATLPNVVDELPTLVAQWNKLWASHVHLQHFDGDIWNLTLLDSRPVLDKAGQRTGEYWGVSQGGFTAQFALDQGGKVGFGIRGGFSGAAVEPTGTPLKQPARFGLRRAPKALTFEKVARVADAGSFFHNNHSVSTRSCHPTERGKLTSHKCHYYIHWSN